MASERSEDAIPMVQGFLNSVDPIGRVAGEDPEKL